MNLAQLTQKVLNLTQLFQQMLNLAKKIDELPEQTALDRASRIHVSKNGISQRLDVQKIIDSIANVSYNRLVAIGSLTIVGGALKIPALAQWVIDNIFYQNSSIVSIPIPFAETDKTRIDLIYANNQNQILRLAGIESAGLAVKPNLPANTIEVTTITVTDSVIGNPSNPEIGYAYILKNQYNEVGPDDGIFYLQQKANYIIIDEAITEIPGLSYMPEYQENLYSGKFILFTNKLPDTVRLINMDPDVDIPFNLNGEDVFLPTGGKVLFSWSSYGYNENGALEVVSYNFGGSSSDLNLDDVLSNGNETDQNAVFTNGTQYVTISSEGSIEIRDASPNGNKKIMLGSPLGNEIIRILSGDTLTSDMFRIESGGNDNAGHSKIGNGQNLIEFLASTLEIRMHQKLKYVGSAATTFSGREIPDVNFLNELLDNYVSKIGFLNESITGIKQFMSLLIANYGFESNGTATFNNAVNIPGNYLKLGNGTVGISQFANEGGYMQWTGVTPGGIRRFLFESSPAIDGGADFKLFLDNGSGIQLIQSWGLNKVSISRFLEVSNDVKANGFNTTGYVYAGRVESGGYLFGGSPAQILSDGSGNVSFSHTIKAAGGAFFGSEIATYKTGTPMTGGDVQYTSLNWNADDSITGIVNIAIGSNAALKPVTLSGFNGLSSVVRYAEFGTLNSKVNSSLEVSGIINLGKFTNGTEPALVSGAIYFNTTLNKIRIGGATAWETVTSS